MLGLTLNLQDLLVHARLNKGPFGLAKPNRMQCARSTISSFHCLSDAPTMFQARLSLIIVTEASEPDTRNAPGAY